MDGKRAAPRKGRRVVFFLGGYAPVGRDPCVPPKSAYPAAGHAGPALQDGMLNRAKRDVETTSPTIPVRDVEDAVPYGRGTPSPTHFYPVISTRVPSLSSTQLS